MREADECSEEEKYEILKDQILRNYFLLRRILDPGFLQHVSEAISADADILKDVEIYVQRLLKEDLDERLFTIPTRKREERKEFAGDTVRPIAAHDATSRRWIDESQEVRGNALEYFGWRFDEASKRGDADEMRALEALIKEYASSTFKGYELFIPRSIYHGTTSTERWKMRTRSFITRSISHARLYNVSFDPGDLILRLFVPGTIELEKIVLEKILLDIAGTVVEPLESVFPKYNKLVNDIISIASVMWFIRKSESEKMEVMNAYYPFSIDKHTLTKLSELGGGLDSLLVLAGLLFRRGFPVEARRVYQFVYTNCADDFYRYLCQESIATTYREEGDYRKALKHYSKALQFLMGTNKEKDYRRLVELKNIGEMHLQLNETDKANKYITEAEEVMENLSEKQQVAVLWNLANAHRRAFYFEEEYDYLNRIVEFKGEEIREEVWTATHSRLAFMNMHTNTFTGAFDFKSLERSERKDRYNRFLERGTGAMFSFQFEKARVWFERARDVSEENEASHEFLGQLSFERRSYETARRHFMTLLDRNPRHPRARAYLGMIRILQNRLEDGLAQLAGSMDRCLRGRGDIAAFLDFIMASLIGAGIEDRLEEITEGVVEKLPKSYEREEYYTDVGTAYTELGLFEEGIRNYERALGCEPSRNLRSSILNNIGTNYASQDRHEEAIPYYKKAISVREDYSKAWYNMSSSYAYLLDYEKAKESIDRALKHSPDNPMYLWQREGIVAYVKKALNIHRVKREKARHMLLSAETMLLDFRYIDKDVDVSVIIVEYAKAVEVILHEEVSSGIADEIRKEWGDPDRDYQIPNELRYGRRGVKRLPPPISMLLSENRNMTTGAWAATLEKIDEVHSNPIMGRLKDIVKKRFSQQEIETLLSSCRTISEYRGPHAHDETMGHEGLLELRETIASSVNDVIQIIYRD